LARLPASDLTAVLEWLDGQRGRHSARAEEAADHAARVVAEMQPALEAQAAERRKIFEREEWLRGRDVHTEAAVQNGDGEAAA
jgi:Ser/Thr protein kinase RdoA (MazF antagonist)